MLNFAVAAVVVIALLNAASSYAQSLSMTSVGQWVMQGDPVAEIVELNQVDVEVAVVEDFVGNLHTAVEGLIEERLAVHIQASTDLAVELRQLEVRRDVRQFRAKACVDSGQPTVDELCVSAIVRGGLRDSVLHLLVSGDEDLGGGDVRHEERDQAKAAPKHATQRHF